LLFPLSGALHRLHLSSTLPGTPVEYMTANYQYQQLFKVPLPALIPGLESLPFSFDARLSYATAFGSTTAVPPNRHFFIGGPDSVRGFDESSLGPRDTLLNPYGGDAAISGQLQAILPIPDKFKGSARLTLFLDFGQAFYLGDTEFFNKNGGRTDYRFDLDDIRLSTGIGVQWLAPLGLFKFSYALPLRYQRATRTEYGDDIKQFQFTIGNAF
jgi:outer membrane protein insertion porin family